MRRDAREVIIESLLLYCEELAAQRLAYKQVLELRVSGPSLQDLVVGEIEGTRQMLDPAFLTLHSYLRERDWIGLRNTLRSNQSKIEAEME